jgi:hypothetical protein
MASLDTYYFDGQSFANASAIYTDAALTTLAPDGYYSQGGIARQQLNGVLLNANDCSTCYVDCGSDLTADISANGVFNADIDMANTVGAVVAYFYMGTIIPDGVVATYNAVTYNRLTAKDNHDGVVLKDGAGTTVDYAGIGNQGTGKATYVGNQNTGLVSNSPYNNITDTCPTQGGRPENYNYVNAAYVALGTYTDTTVVNAQVGYSSDASTLTSPVFTMVIPKALTSPTPVNVVVSAPMCLTFISWEMACPAALPSFSGTALQATTACGFAITTYYFVRNAAGTSAPFTKDTNTIPEIGNFVFTDTNGVTYLNDTVTLQYVVVNNATALGIRNGVVISSASCSGSNPPTNEFYMNTTSLAACNTWCDGTNRTISVLKSTTSNHVYSSVTIGDVIAGAPLADGWFAYAATSTDTATGPFRLMQIGAGNEILNIEQCSGTNCVPL